MPDPSRPEGYPPPAPWAAPGAEPPLGPTPVAAGQRPSSSPTADGFALTSLVLGLVGVGVGAVAFGWLALNRIGRTGRPGRGMAIAGLVLGSLTTAVGAGALGYALTPNRTAAPTVRALSSAPLPQPSPVEDPVVDPTSAAPSPSEGGPVTFDDLVTGQCLRESVGTGNVSEPVLVACTAPHRGQIYAIREAAGGEKYPGETSIRKQADSLCLKADHNLVSKRPRKPHYIMWYPLADRWLDGDHRIICLIGTGSTTTTTSLVRPGSK